MSRRVSLPGADELFGLSEDSSVPGRRNRTEPAADRRASSGRVRHDEKITVYVTADELLDLERTRLRLRGEHGLGVDRGRIVREAIHLALESVETDGEASALVRRLREQ